ncbi:50S ribosomal protein L25/general stress protein Ctc [Piscinibacter sp. Jin2]|uniref:Large ribosomal subunit protein bL25 n=1 Tax=Aquariibacter lacus TaxID=2801332 RepID=A0A9X0XDH9_9BURK|nr:50S ribosomal protein L25/general stress protein Ctc [Piscinibacter lacus]MBL0718807.1 50S ribosomal protein L25/general stress protein Ctc [Piscinibacter lacus]
MNFVAFAREKQGTGASRRLRNTGRTPGIVYGAGEPAVIELDHNALFHALKKEAFHSSILAMELAGTTTKVLLRDVQYHPFKPLILHVDFQRVDATTRIKKKVPLHFVGGENSPAVKLDKCTLNPIAHEIHIECLAEKLPEFLEVDVSNVVKGQTLHVEDVKLPADAKVLTHGKKNPPILSVVEPVAEVIIVAAAPAPEKKKGKK